jgi:hypothetical protein
VSVVTAMVLAGLMASTPADSLVVPPELQVELLAKVVRYDRQFAARPDEVVQVLVVYAPGSAESTRIGQELLGALANTPKLGGRAHRDELLGFTSDEALLAAIKAKKAAIVLFAPELASRAADLARLLSGCACLTVSSTPAGVREGLVLGFDLVSGKPRMLFNLGQSRRQGADFRAELLRLMTVFP